MTWWAKLISIWDRMGRNTEKSENMRAGANEVKIENQEAYDDSRKDAKKIGSRKHTKFGSSGLHRRPANGNDKG